MDGSWMETEAETSTADAEVEARFAVGERALANGRMPKATPSREATRGRLQGMDSALKRWVRRLEHQGGISLLVSDWGALLEACLSHWLYFGQLFNAFGG